MFNLIQQLDLLFFLLLESIIENAVKAKNITGKFEKRHLTTNEFLNVGVCSNCNTEEGSFLKFILTDLIVCYNCYHYLREQNHLKRDEKAM